MYCRQKPLAIVCYAANSHKSFDNLSFWIDLYHQRSVLKKPRVIIVRTKEDLAPGTNPNDLVDENKAQAYANNRKVSHIKTSALTGDGIDDLKMAIFRIARQLETDQHESTGEINIEVVP
jgi:GTPase SAR1 family protein